MDSSQNLIENVSDTAIWVAYYRAQESLRSDALFHDPLAKILSGARGEKIAKDMKAIGRYTEWAVISRTVVIDQFIQRAVTEGVDMVLNLGAGLDTRPYRMQLPESLKWVEVDQSQIIEMKEALLKSETPLCRLERIALDLADDTKRNNFLAQKASEAKKILVLTEGVIPYLSPEEVSSLSQGLHDQASVRYWITEYFDPAVYRYLKRRVRTKKMKNALFRFYPGDWLGFFEERRWIPQEIQYSGDVAARTGRKPPMPWFARLFMIFAPKSFVEKSKRMAGYMLLRKK